MSVQAASGYKRGTTTCAKDRVFIPAEETIISLFGSGLGGGSGVKNN